MRERARAARSRASGSGIPRARRPNMTSPSTVGLEELPLGNLRDEPHRGGERTGAGAAGGVRALDEHAARIRAGGTAMTSRSVVLPDPVWPMRPVTPPGHLERDAVERRHALAPRPLEGEAYVLERQAHSALTSPSTVTGAGPPHRARALELVPGPHRERGLQARALEHRLVHQHVPRGPPPPRPRPRA